jgi:hypothetical protein
MKMKDIILMSTGRNKRPFYSKNEGSCLSMFLPEINELP